MDVGNEDVEVVPHTRRMVENPTLVGGWMDGWGDEWMSGWMGG